MAQSTGGAHPLPERIATRIKSLLASAPDPRQADHFLSRLERESPPAFERIVSSQAALRFAIVTFAYSHFLGETILRYPEWLLQVATAGDLHRGWHRVVEPVGRLCVDELIAVLDDAEVGHLLVGDRCQHVDQRVPDREYIHGRGT